MSKTVPLPLPLPLPCDALLRAPWQRDGWMIRPSPPGGEVPSGIVTFGAHAMLQERCSGPQSAPWHNVVAVGDPLGPSARRDGRQGR